MNTDPSEPSLAALEVRESQLSTHTNWKVDPDGALSSASPASLFRAASVPIEDNKIQPIYKTQYNWGWGFSTVVRALA